MAKIEVTRQVDQKETIDINLPYYYRHNLDIDSADCVVHGMVEENRHTAITVSRGYHGGAQRFELEIENVPAGQFGCYMTSEHEGSEEDFANARNNLIKAIQSL